MNVFSPHLMFELFDLAHVDVVQLAELLLNERLHLLDLAIELAGQVVQLVLEEHVSRGMETVMNISNVKTHPKTDKPYDDVTVISISVKNPVRM